MVATFTSPRVVDSRLNNVPVEQDLHPQECSAGGFRAHLRCRSTGTQSSEN
jgi:hypothetical protein